MVFGMWGLGDLGIDSGDGVWDEGDLGRYLKSYDGDGVEGSVSTDAEVGAGDVVGDGGGDNAQGDAELLEACPALHQLQATHECLGDNGDIRGQCREEGDNGNTDHTLTGPSPPPAPGGL